MKIEQAQFVSSSTRVTQKPSRRLPEFAFIGRSNVGKSSLINMLTGNGKLAKTSQTPGKTKLVNHFLINDSWYLVEDYIFGSEDLVLLFVLLDSRHDMQRIDLEFIADLGENGIPFALIFTKGDKQGTNVLAAQVEKNRARLLEDWEELPPVFVSSAVKGTGKEEILDYIGQVLESL